MSGSTTSGGAAFIFPRSKGSLGQKKIGRGGTPVRLTKQLLEDCMNLPICEAAKLLGLSKTSVKKACRAVGITSWSTKRQPSTTTKHHAATAAVAAAYNPDLLDDGEASAADTNESQRCSPSMPTDQHNLASVAAMNNLVPTRTLSTCQSSGVANMPTFPALVATPGHHVDLMLLHHQLENERAVLEGKFATFRRLVEDGHPLSQPTPLWAQPANNAAASSSMQMMMSLFSQQQQQQQQRVPQSWPCSPAMQSGALPSPLLPPTMTLNPTPHGALPPMCARPSSHALAKLLFDVQQTRTLHCT
ncbi:hypothetical protein T484DRAFT_1766548 [Baffinella frigidus]|nr:hypothetical protein T484DRAFT_1766548 [Cryptophyta sp. CCMP2293]